MKKLLGISSIVAILCPLVLAPASAYASETAGVAESETVIDAPTEENTLETDTPIVTEDGDPTEVVPPVEETPVLPEAPTEDSPIVTEPETPTPPVEEPAPSVPDTPTTSEPTDTTPSVPEPTDTNVTPPTTPTSQEPVQSMETNTTVTSNSATVVYSRELTTEQFVLTIGEQAREIGQTEHLYASVMIAQAILESGSGSSDLSSPPNYNLFGIKGDYNGNSVSYPTQEDDGSGNLYTTQASFKVYGNYQESLADYATLLTDGVSWDNQFYAGTWKTNTTSYQDATSALEGSYATDTSYAEKLNGLIETYNLTTYDEPLVLAENETEDTQAVKTEALQYLGIPYVWGGTTPAGFDCSGLVQYVYQHAVGMDLPRVTTDQEHVGTEVSLTALRTGDLVFFGEHGNTHHVGIYIGNGQFIHAPQTGDVVKITNLADFTPDFATRLLE